MSASGWVSTFHKYVQTVYPPFEFEKKNVLGFFCSYKCVYDVFAKFMSLVLCGHNIYHKSNSRDKKNCSYFAWGKQIDP